MDTSKTFASDTIEYKLGEQAKSIVSTDTLTVQLVPQESLPGQEFRSWFTTIGTAAAIVVAFLSARKLLKRDKKREEEVNSLTNIADRLSKMQDANNARDRALCKPIIDTNITEDRSKSKVSVKFTNSNSRSTLVDFQIKNEQTSELNWMKHTVSSKGSHQFFQLDVNYTPPVETIVLNVDYYTEEGYVFIQQLILFNDNVRFTHNPGAIVDKQRESK